jgi:hypothetical protein
MAASLRVELQSVCEEKTSLAQEFTVGRKPPFRQDLSTEVEESPLSEAITMK